MNLKFNGTTYTTIHEYKKAKYEYCVVEKNCRYFYGEINECMFGENNTDDILQCQCNIDTMFK